METLLELKREVFTDKSTVGRLFFNGVFECYTLEDRVRPVKIKHQTAIPAGRYQVALTFSNRFRKVLPLLLSVPNFEGIRIHAGNDAEDTSGCVLVGTTRGKDYVGNSRVAFDALMARLRQANRSGKIWIVIT